MVILPVDTDICPDIIIPLDFFPPAAERRGVVGHPASQNRDKAPIRLQAQKRLFNVPLRVCRLIGRRASSGCGERRIHQNDGRLYLVREDIVELLRVFVEGFVESQPI